MVATELNAFATTHPAWFSPEIPMLMALSPLAEGTDRIFAAKALDVGLERKQELAVQLTCVMPFAQAEYERDFAGENALEADSVTKFRHLLERARTESALTVFELENVRHPKGEDGPAYGAAGRIVLNQSDLLIVVWDGERQGKVGGTEQTLDEAERQGVPVVWIDAHAPHAWQMLQVPFKLPAGDACVRAVPAGDVDGKAIAELKRIVHDGLALPNPPVESEHHGEGQREDPADALGTFLNERQWRWRISLLSQCFRDVLGDGRCKWRSMKVSPYEESVRDEWPADQTTPIGRFIDRLRKYYAWPDKLAVNYGERHRSVFMLGYFLAALAVFFAVLPLAAGWFGGADHHDEHGRAGLFAVLAELVTISLIGLLFFWNRRGRWHARWLDYRLAAELIRHLRITGPLGGPRPFPQIPAPLTVYGHPSSTWVGWYVRGVERELGLPTAKVDLSYIAQCVGDLRGALSGPYGQVNYHAAIAHRLHNVEHRLHAAGKVLIVGTVIACVLHLIPHLHHWGGVLIAIGAFFPAAGAALAGINDQGEFRRISKRSMAMKQQLGRLDEQLAALEKRLTEPGESPAKLRFEAELLSSQVAMVMASEVLDWRVVFLDRPPVLPG